MSEGQVKPMGTHGQVGESAFSVDYRNSGKKFITNDKSESYKGDSKNYRTSNKYQKSLKGFKCNKEGHFSKSPNFTARGKTCKTMCGDWDVLKPASFHTQNSLR